MSEQTQVIWAVCDRNATQGPRVHQVPSGRTYPLTADIDKPTPMLRSDASIFLRDPAFIVFDENGKEQRSLPQPEAARERVVTDLQQDECVARYDELTLTALRARAAQRPGGAKLDGAPRDQVLEFLIGGNPGTISERGRPAAGASDGESLIDGTLDDDDGQTDGFGLQDKESALAGL
ncbi:hypothetical protein [Falsiroseomonas tokyonensis]|uniref:Uncharacterized protein n=1 Tax=Falsiroseomonas tokyonensis TaxID=430521 RepID=A0ABV7BXC3_9PROT|nr:hypothetical protein [Falsiroseomonas tokyonensis]MBU8540183.1 hypothetical protein [Falsiroseomonas tokyonensis]